MDIVRKIKINKLGIDNLSESEKDMINFVNSELLNLSEFKMSENSPIIYYMDTNGKKILEYNIISSCLHIKYDKFSIVLKRKYNIKDIDIRNIIKYMMGNIFKLEVKYVYGVLY